MSNTLTNSRGQNNTRKEIGATINRFCKENNISIQEVCDIPFAVENEFDYTLASLMCNYFGYQPYRTGAVNVFVAGLGELDVIVGYYYDVSPPDVSALIDLIMECNQRRDELAKLIQRTE